jgi:hypothetical protein
MISYIEIVLSQVSESRPGAPNFGTSSYPRDLVAFQGIIRFDANVAPSGPIICSELYLARRSKYPFHSVREDDCPTGCYPHLTRGEQNNLRL